MAEGDTLLPLGILTLGAAALAGFIAFRLGPWPVSPSGGSLSSGAYVIEILEGQPPAASLSKKASGQQAAHVSDIENGIFALILIWLASKLASGLSNALGFMGGG